MNDAKSYNVLAARLVDLIKNGTGLNQALRAVGLEKKDLPACAAKKTELKKMLKDRFRYDLDIGDYDIPRRGSDENAGVQTSGATISNDQIDINALRERAAALGLKPHPQMGVKKLMAQIQAKEQEIADANNGTPSGNDDETLSATGDENAGVQTQDSAPAAGNAADDAKNSGK